MKRFLVLIWGGGLLTYFTSFSQSDEEYMNEIIVRLNHTLVDCNKIDNTTITILHVMLSDQLNGEIIQLRDISGKLIQQIKTNDSNNKLFTFNVRRLDAGMYFVNVLEKKQEYYYPKMD